MGVSGASSPRSLLRPWGFPLGGQRAPAYGGRAGGEEDPTAKRMPCRGRRRGCALAGAARARDPRRLFQPLGEDGWTDGGRKSLPDCPPSVGPSSRLSRYWYSIGGDGRYCSVLWSIPYSDRWCWGRREWRRWPRWPVAHATPQGRLGPGARREDKASSQLPSSSSGRCPVRSAAPRASLPSPLGLRNAGPPRSVGTSVQSPKEP